MNKNEVAKRKHIEKVSCTKNYSGTSGGMEVAGAVAIFNRSETEYGVRYVKYLGNGDSKGFASVVESAPYGTAKIDKLECIGHIQKRMGSRLRKLRSENKNIVLSDGKKLQVKVDCQTRK